MFIKTLKIKNLKCFDGNTPLLEFNSPDGNTLGSGLNILVGENNTGKSTVFEAIDFLRNQIPQGKDIEDIKNKLAKGDEMLAEILFEGAVNDLIKNFSRKKFEDFVEKDEKTGLEHILAVRGDQIKYFNSKNEKNTLDMTKDVLDKIFLWNYKEKRWENPSGIDADFKKFFEIDFIWADTNPDDIVNFGSTKICGKLIGRIAKNFFQTPQWNSFKEVHKKTFHDGNESLANKTKEIEKKVKETLASQFSDASIRFDFKLPEPDSFFKGTRVIVDEDGIETYMEEKGSGMQRSVALALLQVYADELIKHPDNHEISKPFFLFIDEPEICLHPQAQIKLLSAILELSKIKQIFITTHSPYFFKNNAVKNAGLFLFKRGENNSINILSIKDKSWQLFPWSPSWGEINYHSYNLPTVEFHDELYGFLHQKYIDDSVDIRQAKTRSYIDEFDTHLKTKTRQTRKWTSEKGWETSIEKDVSLQTFIRNKIHHPENNKMRSINYSDKELRLSTEEMIMLCQ